MLQEHKQTKSTEVLNYCETAFDNYKEIKNYCLLFNGYNIYDYMVYIGITNVKEDINQNHLKRLIKKCRQFESEYCNPIVVGESLSKEIYENKNLTLDQLDEISNETFYEWYDNGRNLGLPLETGNDLEIF